MADQFSMDLVGFEDVRARLVAAQIPATPKRMRKILMAGAGYLRDEVSRRAPYDQKRQGGRHLKEAVYAFGDKAPKRKYARSVLVGVSYGGRGVAPHAYMVEHGTQQRFIKTYRGKALAKPVSRGRARLKPFYWPTIRTYTGVALDRIERTLKQVIEHHLKKRAAKAARLEKNG